jgi:hypothetical protein
VLGLAWALAACAPVSVSVPAPASEVKPAGCEPSGDADFAGASEERLRSYLAWLAHAHGGPVGLEPRDVSLTIVRSLPRPGPSGVQVAEISCGADGGAPYRIALYRDALSGRAKRVAYHTVAHEFFHIVQLRRDRLAGCEAAGSARPYEREAEQFAERLVPSCHR